MNTQVDSYFKKSKWKKELEQMRTIALDCGLTEELKWDKPCYSFEKSNVVLIQGFSKYCAFLFFKGVLLKDPNGILKKTGVNTHVGRQIRFTNVEEIVKLKAILKKYIKQAIEVEKSGLKVKPRKNTELTIPEEFQKKLDEIPHLKTAFNALTPGRQRGYIFYFAAAKQSKTRESRIEKCMDLIFDGVGLND